MNSVDKWQSIVTFALGFLPWLFPDLAMKQKIICLCIVIAISALVYFLRIKARLTLALKKERELSNRHAALAEQFDRKRELENRYRKAFNEIGILLKIAILDSEKAKIDDIYRMYIHAQLEIDDGGN